jgi:DNA-directed RNA polymerase specialized sigma subunit
MVRELTQLVLPGFFVFVGGKRRRGRPMSYWKTVDEYTRDVDACTAKLTSELGRHPSVSELCHAMHVSRDTFYKWKAKAEDGQALRRVV